MSRNPYRRWEPEPLAGLMLGSTSPESLDERRYGDTLIRIYGS